MKFIVETTIEEAENGCEHCIYRYASFSCKPFCPGLNKIVRIREVEPLNKGKCNGSLNPEHESDCELMQTGAPVCTCGAENRLHIPTHVNGSVGCGDACKQCGGNSLSCGCC